ncbi:MAG: SurA N-terminal domain-containing protein [Sphingomicrobium sp.]
MLDSFRRLSKSKIGTAILVVFLLAIVASFAMSDVSSLKTSNFGLGSETLAKVGGEEVTDRDAGDAMAQMLNRAREQNPAATYQDLAGEYEPLLQSLIQRASLGAFAANNGFVLSPRLLGAEIAKIPGTRGLDGKFSESKYQEFLSQQRLTDAQLRRLLGADLTQRLLLTPAAANARFAVGMSQPYASMLLEERQGELALIPVGAFSAGLKPTDAEVAAFYAANKARYTVPEQRVLRIARFGPAEASAAAAPSEAEIASYYQKNQASYGANETRVISQAVVPDAKVAAGLVARARAESFAAAAQPAGLSAEDVSVGPQTRAQFTELAGEKVAALAFAPSVAAGTVIGPIQSDLGFHVVRIESIKRDPGKTLATARAEIAAKLAADKRKTALGDLVNRVQDGLDNGESFAGVVASNKLTVSETPLLTAQGKAPTDPAFKLPAELAGALKSGFELTPDDKPVIETLPGDAGFALVALGKTLAAAPAPLAQIRDAVASSWIAQQALLRARAVTSAIAAKVAAGTPMASAVAAAGVKLPPPTPIHARRLQLEQAPPALLPPLKMLFSLAEGKSRMVMMPAANAFAVVRAVKIIPGNALTQPALIGKVQAEFQQGASQEYAEQFLSAVQAQVGVRRNESAIAASKQRLTGPARAGQ